MGPRTERRTFLEFVRQVIRVRHEQPALRRRRFFHGRRIRGTDVKDITWLSPHGQEMTEDDWNAETVRSVVSASSTTRARVKKATRRRRHWRTR